MQKNILYVSIVNLALTLSLNCLGEWLICYSLCEKRSPKEAWTDIMTNMLNNISLVPSGVTSQKDNMGDSSSDFLEEIFWSLFFCGIFLWHFVKFYKTLYLIHCLIIKSSSCELNTLCKISGFCEMDNNDYVLL